MTEQDRKSLVRLPTLEPQSDRWGAVGAGIVLVLLPSLALYFGAAHLEKHESIGLPVVAIFGVMVLVGALALTSTLFRRLKLTSRREPLALPPGSVRATMALALIVLFAIIAVSAMRPPQEIKALSDVSGTALAELKRDTRITVAQAVRERCLAAPLPTAAASSPTGPSADSLIALPPVSNPTPATASAGLACPAADERYSVMVKVAPDAAQQDLVKQLVLTIGQLMTMAVSFYFAGRSVGQAKATADGTADKAGNIPQDGPTPPPPPPTGTEGRTATIDTGPSPPGQQEPSPPAPAVPGPGPRTGTTFEVGGSAPDDAADHDGCAGPNLRATDDVELPEAVGGIRNP